MARTQYQNGSLKLEGKRNPAWFGRWREWVFVEGKRKRVRTREFLGYLKDFPTRKLGQRLLAARLVRINQPDCLPTRTETFSQFSDWWVKKVLSQFKDSTQSAINSQLRCELIPFFGAFLMKDIHWRTLQGFIEGCTKSPKTCNNYILTLKMMWKSAKAGGWASHNPFEDLTLPKCPPGNPFFYTAEEAKLIIREAQGQFKTLYWLAAETGMRPGELCGLRIEDLQLEDNMIRVSHSVWGGKLQQPKTVNARRSIAISEELAAHIQSFLSVWRPNAMNLLFSSRTGGPLHPSSVRRDNLAPICRRFGITTKGMKAFRHCSATMMDQAGTPMKIRQERLGHAPGSKVTMVHYTHSVSADHRSAASAVGHMLS